MSLVRDDVERRLTELGIELPPTFAPVANYVPAVRVGSLVFVSGHGPTLDHGFAYQGKVDSAVSVEVAYQAARLTALNCLSTLHAELGSLNHVNRVVKLLGFVNSDADFGRQPEVINGASDLLFDVFGRRGRHARSAIGVAALPFDLPVEVELVVEVRDT